MTKSEMNKIIDQFAIFCAKFLIVIEVSIDLLLVFIVWWLSAAAKEPGCQNLGDGAWSCVAMGVSNTVITRIMETIGDLGGALIVIIAPAVAAWIVTVILQLLIRRPRPFQRGEQALINMWIKTPSFPSSHAAIAFALLTPYLFLFDADFPALIFPLLILTPLAILIAWSRVRVRVHYVSDVVAGAMTGLIVGFGVLACLYISI